MALCVKVFYSVLENWLWYKIYKLYNKDAGLIIIGYHTRLLYVDWKKIIIQNNILKLELIRSHKWWLVQFGCINIYFSTVSSTVDVYWQEIPTVFIGQFTPFNCIAVNCKKKKHMLHFEYTDLHFVYQVNTILLKMRCSSISLKKFHQ